MNNEEAKFILNGYRANGSDAADTMFAEALKQAQTDPALGAWLARAQAHDAVVAEKLAQFAPPAGLREAILTGGRVSGRKRAAWRQPAWIAAAAAIAMMVVSAAAVWPKIAVANAPLTKLAMVDALETAKHGGHGPADGEMRAELSAMSARLSRNLPVDFAALEKNGCRTLDLDGQSVLEVCFNRNGAWFHCYIARCEDFPGLAAKQKPVFAQNGKVTAVSWADGTHRFVVAGVAGREAIARLL